MKKKLQMHFLLIAMVAVIAVLMLTTVVFYNLFQDEVMDNLHTCANVLKEDVISLESIDNDLWDTKDMNGIRITLIDEDGYVLADSDVDADGLENHKARPEVIQAMEDGEGESVRISSTLSKASYYYAVRLDNGNILRLSKESQSFFSFLLRVSPLILGIILILFILCMVLSHLLARSIVRPIENLAKNMDQEEPASDYKELTPLLTTIQKQHKDLVKSSKMRQEFTANVSHELKTPLTSITGYSELIQNGMAKGKDAARFAGEIHQNASRLLVLINDILQLSELETGEFTDDFEKVNLSDVVFDCMEMLSLNATKRSIALEDNGIDRECYVNGISKMLSELVYNLIDNGIRYNKENGKVKISLCREEQSCILCVEDNGIGIPEKYQERIFERFYRVDKSRSKETGGTGLGLAIVKHVVGVNDAKIQVDSKEGEGTKISVCFACFTEKNQPNPEKTV